MKATNAINFATSAINECVATYCAGADAVDRAGETLRERIAKAILGQKSREKQIEWVFSLVAQPIATHFGVEAHITNRGGISFKDASGTRHDTALSRLRYLCSDTDLMAGSGSSNRSDPVTRVVNAFKGLTPRQRRDALKAMQDLA